MFSKNKPPNKDDSARIQELAEKMFEGRTLRINGKDFPVVLKHKPIHPIKRYLLRAIDRIYAWVLRL